MSISLRVYRIIGRLEKSDANLGWGCAQSFVQPLANSIICDRPKGKNILLRTPCNAGLDGTRAIGRSYSVRRYFSRFAVVVSRPSEKIGTDRNFAGAEQKQKRLTLFLDGTWNASTATRTSGACGRSLAAKSKDAKPQLVNYEVGVNGFLGGVFGQGLDDNIRLAYDWLIENYNDGDEIFIFGFSRGAFTARSLAGLIAIDGILKAGAPIGVSELFDRYKKGNEESIWTLKEMEASGDTSRLTEQEKWLLKYSQPANVKVIGVWDTVGSVGLAAGDIPGISRSQFDYLQTGLRIHILNGYHALAIDEHRNDFSPRI
jgi:uncharacterized protein (DUF2235 family)